MRNTFVDTLCKLVANDKNIYLMTGDLGFGVLNKFIESNPENFINAGIAEQNMAAVAAGMALEGKTVFTYSIANFPTLRCLEQIRNCIAYHNANVKIVSIGAGFAYGAAGMTHHATEDLSIMRAIPNMKVFSPADPNEAAAVTIAAYNIDKPCYIRLGKGREQLIHQQQIENYEIGKALKVIEGSEVAIFATGAISSEAFKAALKLNDKGISTALYTFPTVKPLDSAIIEKYARQCKLIVSAEENNLVGGFGSAVAEVMSELKGKVAILKRIGIPDELSSIVGSQDYLRKYYGLTEENIFEIVTNEVSH